MTQHPSRRSPLLLPLMVLACGGHTDVFEFQGNAQPVAPGGGSGGNGGDEACDGTTASNCNAAGGVGGGQPQENPYRRGGYAGASSVTFAIVGEDGARQNLSYVDVCSDPGSWFLSHWDGDACRAGSLCTQTCRSDEDCAGLDGPLPSRCEPSSQSVAVCSLPCNVDNDCLDGMICAMDSSTGLKSCLIADTPWALGCESFCLGESAIDNGSLLCNRDADCCPSLSCSPDGQCQTRECLPGSWECETDGVPCCDGLSCQAGYCQPQ